MLLILLYAFSNALMADSQDCGFYNVVKNFTILTDPLFSGVRPVKNTRQTTMISVDFTLYAILDLEIKSQTLKTFGRLNIRWKNEYLTWNPEEFCGTTTFSVSTAFVWKPDLFIFEMTDDDKSPSVQYLHISNDGTNIRSEPIMIVSTCGMDTLQFPFDIQTCSLTFGSFLYTVSEISLKEELNSSVLTKISKEIISSKGDWSLLHINVKNRNLSLDELQYSQIVYEITVKRTPSHYIVTLIVPTCFLVLIDLAGMFIPMDGDERLGFKITLVLGFSVLLLILNDLLPSSQGTPILELYIMVCLILMVCSVLEAIFIVYLLQQESIRPVPWWLNILVLKRLACVLAVDTKSKDGENGPVYPEHVLPGVPRGVGEGNEDTTMMNETDVSTPSPKKADSNEVGVLKDILSETVNMRQALNSHKKEEGKSDWYQVAFVLDRLFFLLYLNTVVILTCVVGYVWSK